MEPFREAQLPRKTISEKFFTGFRAPKATPAFQRAQSVRLFAKGLTNVPAIGGCIDLDAGHSSHLLPAEVVLFEPSESEIFNIPGDKAGFGSRLIFLNTPLLDQEQKALKEFHASLHNQHLQMLKKKKAGEVVEDDHEGEFPVYIRLQALRILQQRKFDVKKATDDIANHFKERVQRLPLREADMLQDLAKGFIYWHGRDKMCRPCLVIRIERLGELKGDKERAVRLVLFVLEYGIRNAMVPGRVENWVVIIDLENATSAISFTQIPSLASTAAGLANILESVYCGRMRFVNIVNMPAMMASIVTRLIPAEKQKKVCIVKNIVAELAQGFEPNQLEQRYGGISPDLSPAQTYPFQFFPSCRGSSKIESSTTSMHELCSRKYHEGALWDDSSPAIRERWLESAKTCVALTPQAAEYLTRLSQGQSWGGEKLEAVQDLERWYQVSIEMDSTSRKATAIDDEIASKHDEDDEAANKEEPQPPAPDMFTPFGGSIANVVVKEVEQVSTRIHNVLPQLDGKSVPAGTSWFGCCLSL